MFKKFAYLVSALFLLFDTHESSPKEAGKETAKAVGEAVSQLYPEGRVSNGISTIRKNWILVFFKSFMEEMDKIIDEKFNNEKI